jgi:hypothetical protein
VTSDNSAAGAPDPLIGAGLQTPSDPLIGNDPLIGHDPLSDSTPLSDSNPLSQNDPLQGRAMPTAHSHWIQCRLLHNAKVTVLLNGVRYKSYSGVQPGDDITMRLRHGINTVTFVYQPTGSGASANMEVVESEHHPDIAPLATFRCDSDASPSETPASGGTSKSVTQTFSFVAN